MPRRKTRTARSKLVPNGLAIHCARLAELKDAEDIVILDVGKLLFITDHFVICTGRNSLQLRAIADEIAKWAKEESVSSLGIEGYEDARWILLDYGDVVVHLFHTEARKYYDLDLLWGDAPKVEWSPEAQ